MNQQNAKNGSLRGSGGEGLFASLLSSLSEHLNLPLDEDRFHIIHVKHGKEDAETAKRRYLANGGVIGKGLVIFLEDFGTDEGKAAYEAKQQGIKAEAPVIPVTEDQYPKSGFYDKDKEVDLSDIPDARAPEPEREAPEHKLDKMLLDTDYTPEERRKMGGKVIPFRPHRLQRGAKWGWMY